ncbi:hypothetical protein ACSBR2_035585 [Camellia fascicularis]
MERDPCDGKEASPAETSWSPEIQNHWIEAQDSLKRRIVTEDDFTWKLPTYTNTATASALGGAEVCGVLKYVGGVDVSFSKDDPSIACGTLVVLDLLTLEVVYDDFSVVRLHIPYVPGFLAFREAPILLELLEKMKNCAHPFHPQLLMVDGNGLLHPRGFGLACHLGVLANLPTIGIGKNAMRSTQGSFKPIFISVGHRVSLATAVEIAKMTCKYRVPEPIRQVDDTRYGI